MQGSSQAAMLWHLRQFEGTCADKRDTHTMRFFFWLSDLGYGIIDHSVMLESTEFT